MSEIIMISGVVLKLDEVWGGNLKWKIGPRDAFLRLIPKSYQNPLFLDFKLFL